MKDDKPAVKRIVPKDVEPVGLAVAAASPAAGEPLPAGTHFDNVKKTRRAGKP